VLGLHVPNAEQWQETKDDEGRVVHVVDLEPEHAQEVLNALQSAVFTGKLPQCSWQVSHAVGTASLATLLG
jgi:hypothetical protein